MIHPPSLSLTSLKSTLIYHLIIPLVILFPALVLQPQPYFPAPKFLIHSEPPPTWLQSSAATPDHTLVLGQAWHISLFCPSPQSAATCRLTRLAVERAATRLASVIRFRSPVVARVDLVLAAAATSKGGALGWAQPAGRGVPVRHADDGLVYMYPRALVKQMPDMEGVGEWIKLVGREMEIKWDVEVAVSGSDAWWVAGAGMGEIQSHQYDLEYLLTHELIHALGFGHDLVLHHAAPLPARLSPAYDSHPLANPSTSFTRFTHPSIWNRFTLLNNTPVVKYKHALDAAVANLISTGALRPADPQGSYYRPADVYLALAGHVQGSQAMRDMYDLATRNGSLVCDTGAWPPGHKGVGVKVELETGLVPFDRSSSVGHIHMGGNGTLDQDERLMGWQVKRGVKVSDVGIGPRTLQVLGALGYTLAGQDGWVVRPRGVASVAVDEVRRMQQEKEAASVSEAGGRDAVAWVGVVGVVVAWGVHRGWV